jgi:histidinol dehydrogenase
MKAVAKYTSLFDGVAIDKLEVTKAEIETAVASVSERKAIQLAKNNIENFIPLKRQRVAVETVEEFNAGKKRRFKRLVCISPGGTAPLFSIVLMLAVPANIAGCKIVFMFTTR